MRPVQKKMNVRILEIMRILRTDLEEPVRTKRVVRGGVLIWYLPHPLQVLVCPGQTKLPSDL